MTKTSIFFLVFCFIAVSAVRTFGTPDTTNMRQAKNQSMILNRLNEASRSISTIECDFIQKKHLSFLAENVTSRGKFFYKKENKIRWEYTSPFKYLIAMRNEKYYIKDGNKVSSMDLKGSKLFSELNDVILGCIRGDISKSSSNFGLSFFENSTIYLVRMIPVNSRLKEIFRNIDIYFSKKDFSLVGLRITETTTDYTELQFINRKFNSGINEEVFNIN